MIGCVRAATTALKLKNFSAGFRGPRVASGPNRTSIGFAAHTARIAPASEGASASTLLHPCKFLRDPLFSVCCKKITMPLTMSASKRAPFSIYESLDDLNEEKK
jgi:hypothetical protein